MEEAVHLHLKVAVGIDKGLLAPGLYSKAHDVERGHGTSYGRQRRATRDNQSYRITLRRGSYRFG